MDDSEKDISNSLQNISEKELIKRITKSFKKKNKFKNRKRPKNFSFKKHKRK